jgi:hypothetical protein
MLKHFALSPSPTPSAVIVPRAAIRMGWSVTVVFARGDRLSIIRRTHAERAGCGCVQLPDHALFSVRPQKCHPA